MWNKDTSVRNGFFAQLGASSVNELWIIVADNFGSLLLLWQECFQLLVVYADFSRIVSNKHVLNPL